MIITRYITIEYLNGTSNKKILLNQEAYTKGDENRRIKNTNFASNIRFLREKNGWSLYELAKKLDENNVKDKYALIKRWESGAPITLGNVRRLEKVFKIPYGSLKDPDLSENYDLLRFYYDDQHAKPDTFESPEAFMKWRNDFIKKASEHPKRQIRISYSSSYSQVYSLINNLGFTDYDYDSVDFDNLYESTIEFIKRHHEKNRPQQ